MSLLQDVLRDVTLFGSKTPNRGLSSCLAILKKFLALFFSLAERYLAQGIDPNVIFTARQGRRCSAGSRL